MRRRLRQWADFSKILNFMVVLGFVLAFIISILSCEDMAVGKSKEEIAVELSQTLFEVDSILNHIQYNLLDSVNVNE